VRVGEILSRQALVDRMRAERAAGRTVAFANGCFDILHVGHVRYLDAAAQEADILVVAINDDASVKALKGENRPILNPECLTDVEAGFRKAAQIQAAEVGADGGPPERGRLAAIVKARPDEAPSERGLFRNSFPGSPVFGSPTWKLIVVGGEGQLRPVGEVDPSRHHLRGVLRAYDRLIRVSRADLVVLIDLVIDSDHIELLGGVFGIGSVADQLPTVLRRGDRPRLVQVLHCRDHTPHHLPPLIVTLQRVLLIEKAPEDHAGVVSIPTDQPLQLTERFRGGVEVPILVHYQHAHTIA